MHVCQAHCASWPACNSVRADAHLNLFALALRPRSVISPLVHVIITRSCVMLAWTSSHQCGLCFCHSLQGLGICIAAWHRSQHWCAFQQGQETEMLPPADVQGVTLPQELLLFAVCQGIQCVLHAARIGTEPC